MSARLRIVLIVVVLAIIGGVIALSAASLKGAQDTAVSKYGADAIALCQNTIDTTMSGQLPDTAKIVFIDSGLSTIDSEYQSKLAANSAASDKTNLTHVACTKQTDFLYDTNSYGTSNKYTCDRYRKDLAIALYDVKTSKQVAYWTVEGATPPECPSKTDQDLTLNGNPPIATDIFSALGL